jgi:hypothetical protein
MGGDAELAALRHAVCDQRRTGAATAARVGNEAAARQRQGRRAL